MDEVPPEELPPTLDARASEWAMGESNMKPCRHCGSDDGCCDWHIIDADPPCLDMRPAPNDGLGRYLFGVLFFAEAAVLIGLVLYALIKIH